MSRRQASLVAALLGVSTLLTSPVLRARQLTNAEIERISRLIDTAPDTAIEQAFTLAKTYPPAVDVVREFLGQGDLATQRTVLFRLAGRELPLSEFVPELSEKLDNPLFETTAALILEAIDSEQSRRILEQHSERRFRELTGAELATFGFTQPATDEALPPLELGQIWPNTMDGVPARVRLELDDGADLALWKRVTVISRLGVHHVTLDYVRRNCHGPCEEPLIRCRPVLVHRLPPEVDVDPSFLYPAFVLPGTFDLLELREQRFEPAVSSSAPNCRVSRLEDFEKRECNLLSTLSYRGNSALRVSADYSGGAIELPWSFEHDGHRYFVIDAIDKVHPLYGWISPRGDDVELRYASTSQPICDGGGPGGGPILPDPETGELALSSSHRGERIPFYASYGLFSTADGAEIRRTDSQGRVLDRADVRRDWTPVMYNTGSSWKEGPVETALFGEGCDEDAWPAPGEQCAFRVGRQRYRIGSILEREPWANGTRDIYRLLVWRDTLRPGQQIVDPEPYEVPVKHAQLDLSRVRILFAGDIGRNGGLRMLLELAWPNGERFYELTGR